MELIDGNRVAAQIVAELKSEIAGLTGRRPCLALVRVGEDPASVSYVRKKEMTSAEIGLESRMVLPPVSVTRAEMFEIIDILNDDPLVDGILVQSPLPAHLDEREIFRRVSPLKDVDGFHPLNIGKLAQEDESGFVACTPAGIMELLDRSGVSLAGKHVVVLGRSLIVGKPIALLAMQRNPRANATVTVCHSGTANLADYTLRADVLVVAMGRAERITGNMIKPGATVIDVGINRVPDSTKRSGYRLTGDVHFESAAAVAGKITPVPGGVGPMTVAMLMRNTVKAFRLRIPR